MNRAEFPDRRSNVSALESWKLTAFPSWAIEVAHQDSSLLREKVSWEIINFLATAVRYLLHRNNVVQRAIKRSLTIPTSFTVEPKQNYRNASSQSDSD